MFLASFWESKRTLGGGDNVEHRRDVWFRGFRQGPCSFNQEQFLVPDDGAGGGWRRSGPSLSLVGQRQRGLLEAAERRFLAGRAKQSHRAARRRVPAHCSYAVTPAGSCGGRAQDRVEGLSALYSGPVAAPSASWTRFLASYRIPQERRSWTSHRSVHPLRDSRWWPWTSIR